MQAADEELAAAELAAAQPRLMSKVVVPSPNVYDPRQVQRYLSGLPSI